MSYQDFKLVYVGGPYRDKDMYQVKRNIRNADMVGELVIEAGAYPIIPHKCTELMEGMQSPQFFIEGTMAAMARCDAMIVVPYWQSSEGTIGEIKEMNRLGKPVFFHGYTMRHWMNTGELNAEYIEELEWALTVIYNMEKENSDNTGAHSNSS